MTSLNEQEIPDNISLPDFLFTGKEKYANKKAYIDSTNNHSLTYKELWSGIQKVGTALWQRGWQTGDVVCLYAQASLEFPLFMFAATKIGLAVHPVNPTFTTDEILWHLKTVKAKWLVVSSGTLDRATAAMQNGTNIQEVILLDHVEGYTTISDLLNEEETPFPDVIFDPKTQVALMPCTSGTTGPPKAALHTHYTLIAATCEMNGMGKEEGEETMLMTVPYFGMYSVVYALLMCVKHSFTIIILPKYSLDAFLSAIETYEVTLCYSTPAVVVSLTKTPKLGSFDLSSVKDFITAGAPLSGGTAQAAMDRLPGLTVRQIYGMTEIPPATDPPPKPLQNNKASIGTPFKQTEFKVVDVQTRKQLGVNKVGELLARGPHVFIGYYEKTDVTAAAFEDGWLKTGDVGYYDEHGLWYITGRIKDLIKVGICQVSPEELEAVLVSHKAIADAGVIGLSGDESTHQRPKAFIVKQEGAIITEEEIFAFMQEHVAPTKQLTGGVEFIDAIPRTATAKIQRRLLYERHQ